MSLRITAMMSMLLGNVLSAVPQTKDSDKPEPPATPAQRLASQNNLKMLGLALHNYHDAHGSLPTNLLSKEQKPGLSWRVAILPYLEEDGLYRKFKLDEPWDSENNLKLADSMPKVFAPIRGKAEKNQTFYQMFSGEGTLLGAGRAGVRFADVSDGLSNTFMVVEAGKAVPWTKPDDIPFDGKMFPKIGGCFDGSFNVLLGDGSVRQFPKGVDLLKLVPCVTRADGILVDMDQLIENARAKE